MGGSATKNAGKCLGAEAKVSHGYRNLTQRRAIRVTRKLSGGCRCGSLNQIGGQVMVED